MGRYWEILLFMCHGFLLTRVYDFVNRVSFFPMQIDLGNVHEAL